MGMHQASAIIVPIIIPMHENINPQTMICTKINDTTSLCNPLPPGPPDMLQFCVFLFCFSIVLGGLFYFIWWIR